MGWRDELLTLHTGGWNADDIDEACEAIHEACTEGAWEGFEIADLTVDQVRAVLGVDEDAGLLRSVQAVAVVRGLQDTDSEALQRALYDLDAFAFDFAGDI